MSIDAIGTSPQATAGPQLGQSTLAAPAPAVQNAAPVSGSNAVTTIGVPTSVQDVKHAVDTLNQVVHKVATSLTFSMDQELNEPVVKVVDTDTNQVIRQIPSQQALAIAQALEVFQGMLIRERA